MRGGPSDRHCNRLARPRLNILANRSARPGPSGGIVRRKARRKSPLLCYNPRHELSSARPQVAPPRFHHAGRSGTRGEGAHACARTAAPAPRIPVHGHAWCRQDDAVAHSRQIAQLHRHGRAGRHHRAAVRRVPRLHRDRCRALRRLHRDGRRLQPRRRRDGAAARSRGLRTHGRPLQGLHDRRSAHADQPRLQRDAEDAGGAARARQVHPRDHRPAEDSRHGAVALPAVQPEADAAGTHRVPPGPHPRRGGHRARAQCAAPAGLGRTGVDARCAVADRSGHRVQRRRSHRGGRARHAGRDRPELPGAPARCARRRERRDTDRDRRRDGRAQPELLGGAAGSGFVAAEDRAGTGRARRRAGRLARGRRHPPPGRALRCAVGATVLPVRQPRSQRTGAGARRIRRLHDDAAAHAGVPARPVGRRCAAAVG
ncbi:hypothetical protein GO296_00648 [Ralstonia solanacearum]|nr:hypothetical protein [Ralstonia solanacearum]NKA52784.1 hypothetical protein [Ralstonia solanacearum]NKF59051.1 hypothetical protein [Ralstonia solanacearum]NKF63460.1 hypothetical protein [Ralstonia solanacearum]NKF68473.1 hypothetical protein [Ralstonia solanacearum]